MRKDKNLQEIIKNINVIKWAHLQIGKDCIIENNNKLVQIMNTDDEGHLYFFATVVFQNTKELKQKFYANLDFEDKASPQKFLLSGYVCTAENNFETSALSQLVQVENLLLFKFKILNVEITKFGIEYKASSSSITNLLNNFWKNS